MTWKSPTGTLHQLRRYRQVTFYHSYRCYADDTQIFIFFPPTDTHASAQISACLADRSSWMEAYQVKLNPSKTELL